MPQRVGGDSAQMTKSRKNAALDFLTRVSSISVSIPSPKEILLSQSPAAQIQQLAIEYSSSNPKTQDENEKPLPLRLSTWRSDDDLEQKRKSVPRMSFTPQRSQRNSEISMHDQLIALTTIGGPVSLFSVVPLKETNKRKVKKIQKTPYFSPYLEKMGLSSIAFNSVKMKKVFGLDNDNTKLAESFVLLMEPQGTLEPQNNDPFASYDPYYLDHPDLKSGKNKTVITLPGFLGTIIQPSTASEIKKELNQHFREAHPDLAGITLSHIRRLKSSLCRVGALYDLEASSVAFAHVYLEKLILKNFVNKGNKKLIASICLLLAVKVNDSKDINYSTLVEV